MNAKELISAANCLKWDIDYNLDYITPGHRQADRVLAAHVLATVREDDDEPATEEWAQSNPEMFEQIAKGFKRIDSQQFTRGQLRKLLEVLGAK